MDVPFVTPFVQLAFLLTVLDAQFTCPTDDCPGNPCQGSTNNPECISWYTYGLYNNISECTRCSAGYFAIDVDYACKPCLTTIGCNDCDMSTSVWGCRSCDDGGTLTDKTCSGVTVSYCDGNPNIGGGGGSTTTTPNSNEPTDGDTSDTTETTSTGSNGNGTNGDIDYITNHAVAYFNNYAIYGKVVVMNGHISITINFTDFNFDTYLYELGGEGCLEHGLYFGIYEKWNYNTNELKLGATDCGVSKTGSRWDPWKACSTISSNIQCFH